MATQYLVCEPPLSMRSGYCFSSKALLHSPAASRASFLDLSPGPLGRPLLRGTRRGRTGGHQSRCRSSCPAPANAPRRSRRSGRRCIPRYQRAARRRRRPTGLGSVESPEPPRRHRLIRSVLQVLQHGICRESSPTTPRISLVEGRISALRRLHVLLRHRLLPQPGGFEGFRTIGVPVHSERFPVSEGPHVEPGAFNRPRRSACQGPRVEQSRARGRPR